jgi:Tfp pilus assembly protein PilF
MAIVAAMRKENEAADNAFAKWILLAPADPNAQSSFGYFLIQSNQLARAEKVLERASQTFPTSGLVWANYAECLAKLGRGNASREAQAKAEQFLTPKERASLTR